MQSAAFSTPPADLTDQNLADSITSLAANIAAATARLLALLAEFDRRQSWAGWGIHSCAHWLNWKCGIDLGAAREKVRVAHAVEVLPAIKQAFAAGELSYSKVRTITRIATTENEDYLLMIARHSTAAHVERLVRAYRQADREAALAKANAAHRGRTCTWYFDDEGSLVIKARLPAEAGALFIEGMVSASSDLEFDSSVADGDNARAAQRADALVHLAEQFLARGAVPSSSADRHLVVMHVDLNALKTTGDYARADLDHGPAVAPETARRVACDAARHTIEEDDHGEPLNIGRKTRTIPPAIRRFLTQRDRGCRFPGCTHHRYVDAHHVEHWADGGETSADNLLLLCRRHHRLVHEGGFAIRRRNDDGKFVFLKPAGEIIPEVPTPAQADADLSTAVAEAGIDVSAETCVPKWAGEHLDLAGAVEGVLQAERRLG